MAAERMFLAVDLGASSGRVLAAGWNGQRWRLEEIYRFENGGIAVGPRLYWNLLGLWEHVQTGLQAAQARYAGAIHSVGVDTWGVDFGLLDGAGDLLSNPIHYRDHQTDGIMEEAFRRVPREKIFAQTGLQFLPFNTLFQWLALRRRQSRLLDNAQSFLMMPDLFHWLLTGEIANEYTNATTTQFYNPISGGWAFELLEAFQLPTHLLGRIVQPGFQLGQVRHDVAQRTGLQGVRVVVPGTHDTASAVVAVPSASAAGTPVDWCYLSSGTWSLMGAEVPRPVITDQCARYNFTNEGGVGGTVRLLKNIAGLWLVQECRRIWRLSGQEYSWDQLVHEASQAPLARSLINPDDPRFLAPGDMPSEIQNYCRQTGQPVPETVGQIIRCALDSLALRYRMVLEWLEELIGGPIRVIHVVGGGVQNRLLCQMTADACGRPVLAGPVEATALGNVVVQAIAAGDLADVAQGRQAIRDSFPLDQYEPRSPDAWQEAYERFAALCGG
ncbi:MAG: carbohydrate kinase [Pirellulaceae bacterium]|nr:MAG: carbohydrate kinase [Pirellulaceae bacterium]